MQAAGISTTIIVTIPTFGGIVNSICLFFLMPTFEGETDIVVYDGIQVPTSPLKKRENISAHHNCDCGIHLPRVDGASPM